MTSPIPRLTKDLGQHFLTSDRYLKKIIDQCSLSPSDHILEIGPGGGHLTRHLLKHVGHIYAIEKDVRFIPLLRKLDTAKLTVLHEDILSFDFDRLPESIKVVANIPYNISTPIIEKLIEHRQRFSDIFLTVQHEFAQRLCACAHTKDYGSLTCFAQYYTQPKILFTIPAQAFTPPPKVVSCLMQLSIKQTPSLQARDETYLFRLIRHAFLQRRKTILNALSGFVKKETLEEAVKQAGLSPKIRPDQISLEEYIKLANAIKT